MPAGDSGSGLVLREASGEDVPGLAHLHLAAWRKAFPGILPERYLAELSEDGFRARWRELLELRGRTNLVAASESGEMLGFVAFGRSREDAAACEIYGLYVHPDSWRAGVGTALMRAALERIGGGLRVLLWVMEDNTRARRFYERAGFSWSGRKKRSERGGHEFIEVEYERRSPAGTHAPLRILRRPPSRGTDADPSPTGNGGLNEAP